MIYDVGLAELESLGVNWTRDLRAIANSQNEALEDVTTSVEELFTFHFGSDKQRRDTNRN